MRSVQFTQIIWDLTWFDGIAKGKHTKRGGKNLSMAWLNWKSTGNHRFSHENMGCSCIFFPLNQSIELGKTLKWSTSLVNSTSMLVGRVQGVAGHSGAKMVLNPIWSGLWSMVYVDIMIYLNCEFWKTGFAN